MTCAVIRTYAASFVGERGLQRGRRGFPRRRPRRHRKRSDANGGYWGQASLLGGRRGGGRLPRRYGLEGSQQRLRANKQAGMEWHLSVSPASCFRPNDCAHPTDAQIGGGEKNNHSERQLYLTHAPLGSRASFCGEGVAEGGGGGDGSKLQRKSPSLRTLTCWLVPQTVHLRGRAAGRCG